MEKIIIALSEIFDTGIEKVIAELNGYDNESNIWLCPDGISNSSGTLALHIAGNLQHYIGTVLGNTGYERKRDMEFSKRDVPRKELIAELKTTKSAVINTLRNISEQQIDSDYPLLFPDKVVSTHFMLIHLAAHLNYHLGQINYHRRLLG